MAESEATDNDVDGDATDGDDQGRTDSSSDDDDPDIEAIKEKDDLRYMLSNHLVQIGMLATLPLEAQVLRLIALSGTHGLVSRAIHFLLKVPLFKTLTRCLVSLETIPVFLPDGSWPGMYTPPEIREENRKHLDEKLVLAVEEFMGREHRKRYFVNPHARMIVASLTTDYTRVASSNIDAIQWPVDTKSCTRAPICASISSASADMMLSAMSNGKVALVASSTLAEQQIPPAPLEASETAARVQQHAYAYDYGSIEDICREAKERKVPLNSIIRERAILRMLEHELVFSCSLSTVLRCDQAIKAYVEANKGSRAVTPAMVSGILNHCMDKRTFMRSVMNLQDHEKLWVKVVDSLPQTTGTSSALVVSIVIARNVDPNGPVVKAYIAELRDRRLHHGQTLMSMPRIIEGIVPISRTEGSGKLDREIQVRANDILLKRSHRAVESSRLRLLNLGAGDAIGSKRAVDEVSHPIYKRARIHMYPDEHQHECEMSDWDRVYQRLLCVPRRIGRIKTLYEFLARTLVDRVDNDYVFAHYAFRSSYLFSFLTLELLFGISGGVGYYLDLVPYIRQGEIPAGDGRRRAVATIGDGEAEASVALDGDSSSLES
ncbi:hypothetical protein EV174_005665, partial [Coemansia sp. RSA 2320]